MPQNDLEIRQALTGDSRELIDLQARCPQGVGLVVRNVNTPDFFARAGCYEDSKVFAALRQGRIIGSAACALRQARFGGRVVTAAHQFQGFTDPEARRFGVARRLLQHMDSYLEHRGVDLFYALIMEGNQPSMGLVQSLGFSRLSTLAMTILPVYRQHEPPKGASIRSARKNDLESIAKLINRTWSGHNLFEPASADSLARFISRVPGISLENLLISESGGRITACLGYWDWGRVTEVTVLSLSKQMGRLRWKLRLAGLFKTLPRLSGPGEVLRQWMLTCMGFEEPGDLGPLLGRINNLALKMGTQQIFLINPSGPDLSGVLARHFQNQTGLHVYIKTRGLEEPSNSGPVFIDGIDL